LPPGRGEHHLVHRRYRELGGACGSEPPYRCGRRHAAAGASLLSS